MFNCRTLTFSQKPRAKSRSCARGRAHSVISLLTLLILFVTQSHAHDAYEITSVVYLQTNRIELFVEMEFPTAMKLAGLTPTRDVAVLSQVEAGLTRLREAAGGFYEITAANNVIQPLVTNVEMVVDDHIQFRVEFANTPHRPLRFAARSLKALAEQGGYGASLTVLDMVNKKVLGQTTLFADAPTMEFSVTNQNVRLTATAPPVVVANIGPIVASDINQPTQPSANPSREPSSLSRWFFITLAAGIVAWFAARPLFRR